ncbi:MAG: VOC family protein [Boseongicola sp.]|nr:VOC family protein [Boseongicola sp.]
MPLTSFDHVNVRTAQLSEMISFYGKILGLHPGERPDFDIGGAWLYLGDQALVHLVEVQGPITAQTNPTLEHFAFCATGLTEFRTLLDSENIEHRLATVPGMPVVQVNFYDPDGNHIHVDFDTTEMES